MGFAFPLYFTSADATLQQSFENERFYPKITGNLDAGRQVISKGMGLAGASPSTEEVKITGI